MQRSSNHLISTFSFGFCVALLVSTAGCDAQETATDTGINSMAGAIGTGGPVTPSVGGQAGSGGTRPMSKGGETMNGGAQGAGQPTPMQGGTLAGGSTAALPVSGSMAAAGALSGGDPGGFVMNGGMMVASGGECDSQHQRDGGDWRGDACGGRGVDYCLRPRTASSCIARSEKRSSNGP